jgi:hypothetical protein
MGASSVRRLVKFGTIKGAQVGHSYLISGQDLEAFRQRMSKVIP